MWSSNRGLLLDLVSVNIGVLRQKPITLELFRNTCIRRIQTCLPLMVPIVSYLNLRKAISGVVETSEYDILLSPANNMQSHAETLFTVDVEVPIHDLREENFPRLTL
jgi:hypothetical protein